MLYEFIFFFQAEDGIRDFHVTGVQTCALPIWVKGWYLQDFFDEKKGDPDGSFRRRYEEVVADERISRKTVKAIDIFKRSEERRVGKECRCGWLTDQHKKIVDSNVIKHNTMHIE